MLSRLSRTALRGVWVALLTPWTENDELDEERFAAEVRSWRGTGVHGLYTGGTTGEFYAQDEQTFQRITRIACEQAHAVGLPVQIGCTALSTRTVRKRIEVANAAGADAIQVAIPFWLELHDSEVLDFFREVAQAAAAPLVLYHTSRAKRKLPPQLLGQLAGEVPALIGLKDGCDAGTLRQILSHAPDLSICGGETEMIDRIPAGGRGTYSAVAGMNPPLVLKLYDCCVSGQLDNARPIHEEIRRLIEEVILPMYTEDELQDSAVDRIFRTLGGGKVGLRCQKPYHSPTTDHVQRVRIWCQRNAPMLLPKDAGNE